MAAPPRSPMTRFRLRPRLSFCSIEGRAVLLDIDRNRYFGLPEPANRALHELWQAGGEHPGIVGFESLLRLGIIEPADASEAPLGPVQIAVPPHSLLEQAPVTASGIGPLLPVWRHVVRARREIARGRFSQLHARMTAAPPHAAMPVKKMAEYLSAFRTARRLVPIEPNCLLDSVALFDHLVRYGLRADLVLGVRLDPFSAHCWLQTQDWVLNDPAEHAMTMTPILAL